MKRPFAWRHWPVLVLGSSPTALAVIRELAASGFEAVYLADGKRGCAAGSRHKRQFFHLENNLSLASVLRQLKQQEGEKPWLIPTSDDSIQRLQRLAGSPSEPLPCHYFAPYGNGLAQQFLDKRAFSQRVRECADFPQPETQVGEPETPDKPPLPLPFFCKPRWIHKQRQQLPGKKGVLIQTGEDWRAWRNRFGTEAKDWLFQEIIAGAEDNIALYAAALGPDGTLLGQFTARKLRQYPPGFGSASLVVSEKLPELAHRATAFLQKTGFTGVCCGEFKWCPQRQDWTVIEFNPRPSLWYAVATASRVPLVSLALAAEMAATLPAQARENTDCPAPRNPGDFQPGVLWRYGVKDLASARFYRRHGEHFVFDPPDPDRHRLPREERRVSAVFSWDDPLPVAVEWANYALKAWQRWRKI